MDYHIHFIIWYYKNFSTILIQNFASVKMDVCFIISNTQSNVFRCINFEDKSCIIYPALFFGWFLFWFMEMEYSSTKLAFAYWLYCKSEWECSRRCVNESDLREGNCLLGWAGHSEQNYTGQLQMQCLKRPELREHWTLVDLGKGYCKTMWKEWFQHRMMILKNDVQKRVNSAVPTVDKGLSLWVALSLYPTHP